MVEKFNLVLERCWFNIMDILEAAYCWAVLCYIERCFRNDPEVEWTTSKTVSTKAAHYELHEGRIYIRTVVSDCISFRSVYSINRHLSVSIGTFIYSFIYLYCTTLCIFIILKFKVQLWSQHLHTEGSGYIRCLCVLNTQHMWQYHLRYEVYCRVLGKFRWV